MVEGEKELLDGGPDFSGYGMVPQNYASLEETVGIWGTCGIP